MFSLLICECFLISFLLLLLHYDVIRIHCFASGQQCTEIDSCIFGQDDCLLSVDVVGTLICTPAKESCRKSLPFPLMAENVSSGIDVCKFQFSSISSSSNAMSALKTVLTQIHELKSREDLDKIEDDSISGQNEMGQILRQHLEAEEHLQMDGPAFDMPEVNSDQLKRAPGSLKMSELVAYGNAKMHEQMVELTEQDDSIRKIFIWDNPGLIDPNSGFISREVRMARAIYCAQALAFQLQATYKRFKGENVNNAIEYMIGGVWINDRRQKLPNLGGPKNGDTIVEAMRELKSLKDQLDKLVNGPPPVDFDLIQKVRDKYRNALARVGVMEKAVGGSSMALMGLIKLGQQSSVNQNALLFHIRANDAYKYKENNEFKRMLMGDNSTANSNDHEDEWAWNALESLKSVDLFLSHEGENH